MKHNANSTKHPSWCSPAMMPRGQSRFVHAMTMVLLAILSPWMASAAGPVVQLLWSVQPGSAAIGSPFGQQPTLVTADAAGNPSTVGLAGSVSVKVDTAPPGGLSGGSRTVDIGTAAGNGVINFSGLQIDTAGGYTLAATTGNGTNGVVSPTNGIGTCQLWLDAADNTTLTVTANNNLTFWADKSGTGNNATNVTGGSVANTPLTNINSSLAAFASGAQRVVGFYGTNRLNIDLTRITNSTFSIVALTILNPTVTPNNDYFAGTPFNNVDNTLHLGYRNTLQYTFAFYADDLNVATPGSAPVVTSHIHPAGSQQIFINGTSAGSRGSQNLGPVLQGNIGRGNGGNFHGDMAEFIVYRTNLTALQRVGVENYLANKWLGQLSGASATVPFFVSGGSTPKGINITQQPTTTVAGVNISPGVVATVTNASGGGISGLTVIVSLLNGSGTLNGTLSQVTDGSGNATFSDLNLTVADQKQLRFTIPGVVTNDSSTFNIIAAAASQLAFKTPPSTTGTAGVALATQPVVAVEDAFGNVVSNVTDVITASQTAGGNLNQTAGNSVQVAAVSGTAAFSGLYLTNAATSQLTFSDGALSLTVNSANIVITPNIPSSMVVQQQPSSTAQVGVVLGTQPMVSVLDAYGNAVANGTSVVASVGSGGVLGDGTETTTGGVATYSSISLTNVGNITLTFTAGSVSTNSTPISVSPGPATTVQWTTQPGSALAGSPFGQQPVLKTVDAGGNVTTLGLGATQLVVVHLISGSGLVGNSLTYNIGTSGSNGMVTFQNLQINTPGAGNILSADYLADPTVPTNGIPDCILWLDAYNSSALTLVDTNLTAWADESGTGNHAANTANYPTTNLNTALPVLGYGGQHTVSFLGNNWLNVNVSSIDNDVNGYTVIAVDVANPAALLSTSYFFGSLYNGIDASLGMGYISPKAFRFQQYADDVTYTAPANFTAATPRLWTGRLDSGANQNIFLNGVLKATRVANAPPGILLGGLVGAGSGGNYNGDLAEIIVYNRGLSDTERTLVEQYLAQKWLSNSRSLTAPFTVTGSGTPPTLAITPGPSGNVTLNLTGSPGVQYRILGTTNLTLPIASWQGVATNTLDGSGLLQLMITNNLPDQFYRAVTP